MFKKLKARSARRKEVANFIKIKKSIERETETIDEEEMIKDLYMNTTERSADSFINYDGKEIIHNEKVSNIKSFDYTEDDFSDDNEE